MEQKGVEEQKRVFVDPNMQKLLFNTVRPIFKE